MRNSQEARYLKVYNMNNNFEYWGQPFHHLPAPLRGWRTQTHQRHQPCDDRLPPGRLHRFDRSLRSDNSALILKMCIILIEKNPRTKGSARPVDPGAVARQRIAEEEGHGVGVDSVDITSGERFGRVYNEAIEIVDDERREPRTIHTEER